MKNSFFFTFIALFFVALSSAFAQENSDTLRNFHIGFIYPISSNGVNAGEYTNKFSLHAIAGVAKNEMGTALTGFASIARENVIGTQISGFMNTAGKRTEGAQVAGFLNITQELQGVQVGGFGNIAGDAGDGVQISGFINKADDVNSQIAGFINVARKVKGVQIAGFMNVAEESDYPIGVLNLVKNGVKGLGVTYDENETALLSFRSGGRILYGILGAGYHFGNRKKDVIAVEAGLGARLPIAKQFVIRTEIANISYIQVDKWRGIHKGVLRVMPAFSLGKHLEVFGGPTLNVDYYETETGRDYFGKKYLFKSYGDDDWVSMRVGYVAGIQVNF